MRTKAFTHDEVKHALRRVPSRAPIHGVARTLLGLFEAIEMPDITDEQKQKLGIEINRSVKTLQPYMQVTGRGDLVFWKDGAK